MAIVKTDDIHYKNIASRIRKKTGKSTTYTPAEMPSGIKEVYEAGKNVMWDGIQDYGNRFDYKSAFAYWNCEYIHPKHKVSPTDSASTVQTFYFNKSLKKVEKEYFDFSNCERATYNSGSHYYTFCSCPALEVIEDVGIKNVLCFGYTFAWCGALHTIECIYPDENTQFDGAFVGCYELVHLGVDGTIGQNGFNVSWSTKLDKESHINIFNAFSTTAEISATFSYEAINKAFETSAGANDGRESAEWSALRATRPNVTVLYA